MLLVGPVSIEYFKKPVLGEPDLEYYVAWYQTNTLIIVDNSFIKINNLLNTKDDFYITYATKYQDVDYAYTHLSIYALNEKLYRKDFTEQSYEQFVVEVAEAIRNYPDVHQGVHRDTPIYEIKPNLVLIHPENDRINVFQILTGYNYAAKHTEAENTTIYKHTGKSVKRRLKSTLYKKSYTEICQKGNECDNHFISTICNKTNFLEKFMYEQINFIVSFDYYTFFNPSVHFRAEFPFLHYNLVSFTEKYTTHKSYAYFIVNIYKNNIRYFSYEDNTNRYEATLFMKAAFKKFLFELYYPNIPVNEFFSIDKRFIVNRISDLKEIEYESHGEVICNYSIMRNGEYQVVIEKNMCLSIMFSYPTTYNNIQNFSTNCTVLIAPQAYQKVFYNYLSQDKHYNQKNMTTNILRNILVSFILDPDVKVLYSSATSRGKIYREYLLII